MNDIRGYIAPACVLASTLLIFDGARAQSGYVVTERGPDYKILQKTVLENGTNHVHRYTAVATGMNYTNAAGQLVEAQERISILPAGGAAATQGRHQVFFPGNIFNGVLEVVTPDGWHLRSRPLGVSYDDGSNVVWIAQLKSAIGYLTSSNQVVYRDAFTGFRADLVCTYRRSGFECDLVFRQKPPAPADLGLDAGSSTIQLVTEFFNTTEPQQIPSGSDEWLGLEDSTLKFGRLEMAHGRAFAFKPGGTNYAAATYAPGVPVYKTWTHIDGRTFLIEEVPLIDLADDLGALPLTASADPPNLNGELGKAKPKPLLATADPNPGKPAGNNQKMAAGHRQLPPARGILADTNQVLLADRSACPTNLLALADWKQEPGVVLDYNLSGTVSDFIFSSGETYRIAGWVECDGTTVFQGGAIIKYTSVVSDDYSWSWTSADGVGCLFLMGPVVFTGGDRTYFTTTEDDSIGEGMSEFGMGPSPASYYCGLNLQYATPEDSQTFYLDNVELRYAAYGIILGGWGSGSYPLNLTGSSFVDCGSDFYLVGASASVVNCTFFTDAFLMSWIHPLAFEGTTPSQWPLYEYPYSLVIGQSYQLAGDSLTVWMWGTTNFARAWGGYSTVSIAADITFLDGISSPLSHYGPVLMQVNGQATDDDHDGLPDWWELKYFGSLNRSASDLDASGRNTLLDDYQNSRDPNDTDVFFDFQNVTACAPLPINSYGFSQTQPPYLKLNDSTAAARDTHSWIVSHEEDPHLTGKTFYRVVTTTWNYVAGQKITKSEVKPYYFNAATPDDPASTPTDNFYQDLRVTGWPDGPECFDTVSGNPPDGSPIEGSSAWCTCYDQINCPPPTFVFGNGTETCIQHFPAENPPPGISYPTWAPVTCVTELSAPMTVGQVMVNIQTMLDSVVLSPSGDVATREGSVYFNYHGETAINVNEVNLLPAGAVYDDTGHYTFPGLSPNQLYAFEVGPNEGSYPLGGVASSADLAVGALYPIMWANGTTPAGFGYSNPLGTTAWEYISASQVLPTSSPFVTRTASVVFSGGHSAYPAWQSGRIYSAQDYITDSNGRTEVCVGAGTSGSSEPAWATGFGVNTMDGGLTWQLVHTPVTAKVTRAHVNRLLLFPIKSGTIITCEDGLPMYPAYKAPPAPGTDGPEICPWGDTCSGMVLVKSRLHIPSSPTASDPAQFGNLRDGGGVSFRAPLENRTWLPYGDNLISSLFRAYLPPGDFEFGPGNINGMGSIIWEPGRPIPTIDLDVDSDNVNGLERSQHEDSIEDQPPGKYLTVNNGDEDGDGIPNFADGYDLYGTPPSPTGTPSGCCQSASFTPMVLDIGADLTKAKVRISYSASDPANVTETANADGSITYIPAPGGLRVWTKDGNQFRKMATVDHYATIDGQWVQDGCYVAPKEYSATNVPSVLYIEGITPGTYTIKAEVDPDGQTGYVVSDEVVVTVIKLQLALDGNRDDTITFDAVDETTANKPYRFWVNDDQDYLYGFWGDNRTSGLDETVPASTPDYQNDQIKTIRDLEDFTRLNILVQGLTNEIVNGTYQIGLKWKNTTGSPAVKLFRNLSPNGDTEYLTDSTVAQSFLSLPPGGFVAATGTYLIPPSFWQWAGINSTHNTGYIIFEGCSVGRGQLVVTINRPDGTELAEAGSVWLDIKDIKTMYQRFDGSGNNQWPSVTFDQDPNESKEVIVFVHGWRMSPEGASSFAESMFKRLWWRGYKGRFAAFRWNTFWNQTEWDWLPFGGGVIDGYLARFNDSESNAWAAGAALKSFVDTLPAGYTKNIAAHSMGNIVAGSALLSGMTIDNYALLQAAVPACCYDDSASMQQNQPYFHYGVFLVWDGLPRPDFDSDSTTRALSYRGRLKNVHENVQGGLISFALPNDYATFDAWEVNNEISKPPGYLTTSGYYYYPLQPSGNRLFYQETRSGGITITRYLTNPFEAMPYACRAWSKAAGAELNTHGSISGTVDLSSPTYNLPDQPDGSGFYDQHSAEFKYPIQDLKLFYSELLRQFNSPQNP